MDHIKILKRAFKITWDYKALWIFGIILALTVASGGGGGNGGGSSSTPPEPDRPAVETPGTIELPGGEEIDIPQTPEELDEVMGILLTIGAIGLGVCGVCCCLFIVWIVVWTVLRYVAETALIRMVDIYEETGEKRGIIEGFKMGWSIPSLWLFLIDLLLFLAGAVVVFLALILIAVPSVLAGLMIVQGAIILGVIFAVAAVGLVFLFVVFGFIVKNAVRFVRPFFQRACVLENLSLGESLARSLDIVKRHFAWDIVIMWLIVVGLELGWIVATILLILPLLFVALVVAAIPALVLGGLVSLVFSWIPGLIAGGVVGSLIFFAFLFIVGTFLQGLRMTFLSTLWTLTYRELLAIEGLNANGKEPWEAEYQEEEDSHELQ